MAGFQTSDQSSRQQQASHSVSGLRGTPYAGEAARNTAENGRYLSTINQNAMGNIAADPGQYFRFGQSLMPGGQYGLGSNVDNAVAMYGRNMFNQTSSDMAQRGFSTPESQNAVIGSSIQNSLPALIPQMMQFQQQQFAAPQNLLQSARTSADFWNQALGQQSDSQGTASSRGYGFGMQVAKFA